jgi:hypothetical protein
VLFEGQFRVRWGLGQNLDFMFQRVAGRLAHHHLTERHQRFLGQVSSRPGEHADADAGKRDADDEKGNQQRQTQRRAPGGVDEKQPAQAQGDGGDDERQDDHAEQGFVGMQNPVQRMRKMRR